MPVHVPTPDQIENYNAAIKQYTTYVTDIKRRISTTSQTLRQIYNRLTKQCGMDVFAQDYGHYAVFLEAHYSSHRLYVCIWYQPEDSDTPCRIEEAVLTNLTRW